MFKKDKFIGLLKEGEIMNKKGAELPLNTLIVIILVVIVLIVVAIFFLGGTSSLSRTIRGIFFGTTAGTDLNLAIEQCNTHCGLAQSLPGVAQINSGYCKQVYDIDLNQDGKVTSDSDAIDKYCWESPIGVVCSGLDGLKPLTSTSKGCENK